MTKTHNPPSSTYKQHINFVCNNFVDLGFLLGPKRTNLGFWLRLGEGGVRGDHVIRAQVWRGKGGGWSAEVPSDVLL